MSVCVEKEADTVCRNVASFLQYYPTSQPKKLKRQFIVARALDHTIAEAVCSFAIFRVLERCVWGLRYCGMRELVPGWLIPYISDRRSCLAFKGRKFQRRIEKENKTCPRNFVKLSHSDAARPPAVRTSTSWSVHSLFCLFIVYYILICLTLWRLTTPIVVVPHR